MYTENSSFEQYVDDIREKEYDRLFFVSKVLEDDKFREFIVNGMMSRDDIMLYYHCYEIAKDAAMRKPTLFVKYKELFIKLLSHENSYHRDFGLSMLALISADHSVDFLEFSEKYLACLHDEKMMTAQCCIVNLATIIWNCKKHTGYIVNVLLRTDNFLKYTEKQRELLYNNVIDAFEVAIDNDTECCDLDKIRRYVSERRTSISPKTRRKAKQLFKKLSTITS